MATPIDKAAQVVGGRAALARALGITSQAVYKWRRVPAERVIDVERATRGLVTRHELRPDLYPRDRAA